VNFADRIRGVLKPPAAGPPPAATPRIGGGAAVEDVTGGHWRTDSGGRHFVVESRIDAGQPHGRARVDEMAASIESRAELASLLTSGAPARTPFVFFDLETTGLSGGAGTYAFLVGCGSFSSDGSFAVRQHLMISPGDERAMLRAVAGDLESAGALVSFNGKSFDAPVLETRYLFHRLAWPAGHLTHVDALHPSRCFWGETGGCSLAALEAQVLGARRAADVAGIEIPARYFQFLRTGDARPLGAVLEHNRRDLLSLAALTSRLLQLLAAGPSASRSAQEAFALGRVYRTAGLGARADEAFARALDLACAQWSPVRTAALHALALSDRHARRYDEAADRWQALVDAPDCPPLVRRAAVEALAIHHEHRVRNLSAARAFALKGLESPGGPAWRKAVRRRLTRIDRKLERDVERRVGADPPVQMLLDAAPVDS
jgi:uncharacterized protein YprB with RNaseH-like and TPR domain